MTGGFAFEVPRETAALKALRREVRTFLDTTLAGLAPVDRARSWSGFDPEFSRALGARGWIGMTWPREYGGGGRTALERFVVQEELLAAGAPVSAHWVADRQSGPLVLRYGTEPQRRSILPRIARGELCFCIGMSEADSGSDLASIRTRAERTDAGWRIDGAKLWTSNAPRADYMIALVRTARRGEDPHTGLSQFLIDLATPGIAVRPIASMAGGETFAEVAFDGVDVPVDALLGREGEGWRQVTAELALERSGPERFMSSIAALFEFVRVHANDSDRLTRHEIGMRVARLAVLRRMSAAIAASMDGGAAPAHEAALVKLLGVDFEQGLPAILQDLSEGEPGLGDDLGAVLGHLLNIAPSFSLRGGSREILLDIVARGLGLR